VLVVLLPLLLIALWWLSRQAELFRLSVRDGRLLVVRGRIPPGLLHDMKPVLAHTARGTVYAHKHQGGARLSTSADIDSGTAQQLRNVFGLYPIAKLRHAPLIARPTLGQLLGVAWLAWLFERDR
jgi:hypothetical protein